MSDVAVAVTWAGEQRFEAVGSGGVAIPLDGGKETGPSPMETLLVAIAGCTGADVVEILSKMRVPLEALEVAVEGDRRPEPPRRYTAIRLVYRVRGVPADDRPKLERAVALSRDTYCSVMHSLQPDLDVTVRIEAG